VCSFPVENGALFVQKKIGFKTRGGVRVGCRRGVSATSFFNHSSGFLLLCADSGG